jgi:hypothetical protein
MNDPILDNEEMLLKTLERIRDRSDIALGSFNTRNGTLKIINEEAREVLREYHKRRS